MKEWFNENWLYVVVAFGSVLSFEILRLIFKKIFRKLTKKYLKPFWGNIKKLKRIETLIVILMLIIIALICWNIYYMFFR